MAERLTARQRRFVEEYLVDRCGSAAAERAGYAASSARRMAWQLLHETPQVREAIDAALREQSERIGVTADDVIRGLVAIAKCDQRRAYDEHGRRLLPHLLPDDVAAGIASIDTEEVPLAVQAVLPLTDSEGRPVRLARTTRIRYESKLAAWEALARHFGLFRDGGGGGRIDLAELERAIARAKAADE